MKNSLKEELERIHQITYGNETLSEGFVDKVLSRVGFAKVDDPKRADLISPDVQKFYNIIRKSAEGNGITQQERGSMNFQREVEAMQIGLTLLGYELPKYGIDGLFGPETAKAVGKFKLGNDIINETVTDLRRTIMGLGYTEKGSELTSGGKMNDKLTKIVETILKQYKQSNPSVDVTITSGNDKFHQNVGYHSKHSEGNAIDVTVSPYNSRNADSFKKILDGVKDPKFKYIDEYTNPSSASTGGHFHMEYDGQGTKSGESKNMVTASPKMLEALLDLLKQKGVRSEDLTQLIDPTPQVELNDSTNEEIFSKILGLIKAPTTKENIKFMRAWRQAEGKGGEFNPFNTTLGMKGSTNMNSVGVKNYQSIEDGIVATVKTLLNGRYDCIVDGLRDDIGADQIAVCDDLKTWGTGDLVGKVINGYNNGNTPKVSSIA